MEQNRTKQTRSPQPGDLIEIFRPSGVYEHWAIYIGDGYVVHVAPNVDSDLCALLGIVPKLVEDETNINCGGPKYVHTEDVIGQFRFMSRSDATIQVVHPHSGLGPASSSASLGSAFGGTPTVQKQKLKIVVGDDSYQINNKYDHKYRPLPAKEIVETALSRVGQKVDYGVFTNNCEHFVTLLRYGESVSEQALNALQVICLVSGAAVAIFGQLLSRQRQ